MCGRYYVDDDTSREIKKITEELDKKLSTTSKKARIGEVVPSNDAVVLIANGKQIEPDVFRWGFPNYKNQGIVINARAETVCEKPMFRSCVASRRCAIPANGFYEWNAKKEKFYFTPQTESILYMAGIYTPQENETCFAILTTTANVSMQKIHDRMPLLLTENQLKTWIYDDDSTQEILRQVPYSLRYQSDYEQQTLKFD